MPESPEAALELLALARLDLLPADLPSGAGSAPSPIEALRERGLLRRHQALAARSYLARHARTCACGARTLAAADGEAAAPCPACGRNDGVSDSAPPDAPPGPADAVGPAPALGVGSRVGPLVLEERLGEGASGAVYRARHVELGRCSAVKVVPCTGEKPGRARRVERELEALARLAHPSIVQVHAAYDVPGGLAFDMDLVEGEALSALVAREGPLPWRRAAALALDLARALDHAHRAAVLHRDVKPDNVLVRREDGRAMLVDFGLSRFADRASSLTAAGGLVGTPYYMAPEAFAGDGLEQSDVYGVGVVLYEALTGAPPFRALTLPELRARVARGRCEPTRAPGAPPDLERVRACAMAPALEERYASAAALALDLERVLAGQPTSVSSPGRRAWLRLRAARRPLAALAALGLLLLAAAHPALVPRGAPPPPPSSPPPPRGVEGALADLRGGDPRREAEALAALRAAVRLSRSDELPASIDAAVAAAPGDPRLRWLRAALDAARGRPLRADDLRLAAAHVSAADLDDLVAGALAHGLAGPGALDVVRGLCASRATGPLRALLGVTLCAQGDPALRAEGAGALEAAATQAGERGARLLRALRAADHAADALARGDALARAPVGLTQDADALELDLPAVARDLPAAVAVVLAPLGPVLREALRRAQLLDPLRRDERRAVRRILGAGAAWLPPLVLVHHELLSDVGEDEDGLPTPPWTQERSERLRAAGDAVAATDPLLAACAYQLAARRETYTAGAAAAAERLDAWNARCEELVAASTPASPAEEGLALRLVHRSATDRAEVVQRVADVTPDAARARELRERALGHAERALALSGGGGLLETRRDSDAGRVVRLLLALGRPGEVERVLPMVYEADAVRAEVLRRSGDAGRARDLAARALVGAPPRSVRSLLAALALAEADLGRPDEARAALARLRSAPDDEGCIFPELEPTAVESYLRARRDAQQRR